MLDGSKTGLDVEVEHPNPRLLSTIDLINF